MTDLHMLDPRAKIAILLCLSTAALLYTSLSVLLGLAAFTFIYLLLSGIAFHVIVRQAGTAVNIVIFLFLLQCLFVRSGEALLAVGGITFVTDDGFFRAAMLSLRFLIFILSALLLFTGEPRDYLLALVQCRVPYEIAFMVLLAFRFFPILRDEALNLYYCVQFRGTEIEKAPLRARILAYRHLCLPILVASLTRAKTMSAAMEAKCFRAVPKRTYMRRLTLNVKDKICLVVFPLGLALLLFITNSCMPTCSFAAENRFSSCTAAASEIDAPKEILLSWAKDPKSTQTITWSSESPVKGHVEYVKASFYESGGKSAGFSKAAVGSALRTTITEKEYYRYESTITGLSPDTTYYYRVANGSVRSGTRTFRTAPKESDKCTFLFMGDVQFEIRNEDYAFWGDLLQTAAEKNPEAAFAVMGGDYVDSSANPKDWHAFLSEGEEVFSEIPLMSVPGNHETSILPTVYLKMTALPKNNATGNEEFYSFNYGNCHFLMLNSCFYMPERKNSISAQVWEKLSAKVDKWVENDLKNSKAKWNIVVLHHPPYPIAEDDTIYETLREHWVPFFEKYTVNLVLCGHQHVTMRTKPINGVTYLMGNSGVKRSRYYDGTNAPGYAQFINTENSTYQRIAADTETLTITTYNEKGETLDTCSVVASEGGIGYTGSTK